MALLWMYSTNEAKLLKSVPFFLKVGWLFLHSLHCDKIWMWQDTKATKYKCDKIQKDKIQMRQNSNRQILQFLIDNVCICYHNRYLICTIEFDKLFEPLKICNFFICYCFLWLVYTVYTITIVNLLLCTILIV